MANNLGAKTHTDVMHKVARATWDDLSEDRIRYKLEKWRNALGNSHLHVSQRPSGNFHLDGIGWTVKQIKEVLEIIENG